MRRTLVCSLCLLATLPMPAAEPTRPPLDAAFLRRYAETRGFTLGRPSRAKPTPDGAAVLFLRGDATSGKMRLYEFDAKTRKTRELLTPDALLKGAAESLSPEERARRERMRVVAGGFADFLPDPVDGTRLLLPLSNRLYVFDRPTGKVTELATGPGPLIDPKWSPDGKRVAYVRDHNVRAFDLATGIETAVTTTGTEHKPCGLAEFVAQEEMGRLSGFWFSPDSSRIAFEEYDSSGVETWHVADPSRPDAPPLRQSYPRPGKANVTVRVGVAPVAGGPPVWFDWSKGVPGERAAFPYLAQVHWPKSGPLTLVLQTRRQDVTLFAQADPATGRLTAFDRHTDATWTNLRPEEPKFLDDGSYLHVLEHAKSDSLVRFRVGGGTPVALVPESAGLNDISIGEVSAGRVLFTAAPTPGEVAVYAVDLSAPGTPPRRLTPDAGQNALSFSRNGALAAHTLTTLAAMPVTRVLDADLKPIGELPSLAAEPGFAPDVTVERVGEGEGFYAALVRPAGFVPGKKYPVIVDVYGGPRHLTVIQSARPWLRAQFLADQGFVVVGVDNRGTPGRGRDWERAAYRQFGNIPLEDQVAGLKALAAKHPEIDLTRVGIVGWSFGGYMAANAALRRPDVFRAAVAGAPVTDWEDYDTHYTERYMGLLPEDAAAYQAASLLPAAKDLRVPLLLVHGTADDNVYFRHSLRLADALFRAGRDFEVLPLAGQTHMVADPAANEQLWTRVARFFRKHL